MPNAEGTNLSRDRQEAMGAAPLANARGSDLFASAFGIPCSRFDIAVARFGLPSFFPLTIDLGPAPAYHHLNLGLQRRRDLDDRSASRMKAEHRKELQTNTLAASMTRLVQRVKTRPQRRTVLWVVGSAVIILLVVGYLWLMGNRHALDSQLWLIVDLPTPEGMKELNTVYPSSRQGLAARFQLAYIELWEVGIKQIPTNPKATDFIKQAMAHYTDLAEEAKDDPILLAEARYQMAVGQESLALVDPRGLDDAVRLYKKVDSEPCKDTARAVDARERLKVLENARSRQEVDMRYMLLRAFLGNQLPRSHPPLPSASSRSSTKASGGR
jgi:hypothetical protein